MISQSNPSYLCHFQLNPLQIIAFCLLYLLPSWMRSLNHHKLRSICSTNQRYLIIVESSILIFSCRSFCKAFAFLYQDRILWQQTYFTTFGVQVWDFQSQVRTPVDPEHELHPWLVFLVSSPKILSGPRWKFSLHLRDQQLSTRKSPIYQLSTAFGLSWRENEEEFFSTL